jgi:hypothetical protein
MRGGGRESQTFQSQFRADARGHGTREPTRVTSRGSDGQFAASVCQTESTGGQTAWHPRVLGLEPTGLIGVCGGLFSFLRPRMVSAAVGVGVIRFETNGVTDVYDGPVVFSFSFPGKATVASRQAATRADHPIPIGSGWPPCPAPRFGTSYQRDLAPFDPASQGTLRCTLDFRYLST